MTRPTTDDTRPDTIRDAFEAIVALFRYLIMGRIDTAKLTTAERTGVDAGDAIGMVQRERSDLMVKLFALRDLIQRAAEEHNRRSSAAAAAMPPERLREMRERCDKATPGPWAVRDEGREGIGIDRGGIDNIGSDRFILNEGANGTRADLEFAAHARTDLPAALAEIERLTAERSELRAIRNDAVRGLKDRIAALEAELAARAPADARVRQLCQAARALLAGSDESNPEAWNDLRAAVAAVDAARDPSDAPAELAARAPADASLEARAEIDSDFAKPVWTATIKDRVEDDDPISVAVVSDGTTYQPRFFGLGKWRDPAPDFGYRILSAWALASRPATEEQADLRAITIDWPRTNARRGALMDREDAGTLTADEITELADLQRLADMLVDKMHRDASRPGLTEEQARAWERLRTAATTAVEAYEDSDADEAFEPLFAALDEALAGLATAEEESASRGETGPAAEPTRAERVAEAQRLRAEARAEAEACTVPMPADLLARYPRSADPPEPDRPTDLGPGIGGAPIRVRPTGAPDPRATLHAGNSPSLPDGSGVLVPHPANVLASKRGGK